MIIILGVAGSGKSTQSQLLVDRLGMNWVSTGELCRRVVTGKRREEMLAGKVLDQDEVTDILDAELKRLDNKHEIILDGFPRGLKQVAWLLHQEKIGRLKLDAIIHLHANMSEVKDRMLARGRQDDTEKAIAARFKEYQDVIKPIKEVLGDNNVPILEINAEQTPDEVYSEIIQKMHDAGISA